MRRVIAALVCAAMPIAAARAAAPVLHGPHETAAAILATELAFEHRSEHAGAAAAFADYMDPVDGLEFGGGDPIRGAAAIAAGPGKTEAGGTLAWVPREVFASTGDMGVVWGTWSFTIKGVPKPVTGRYVTVWRRNEKGAWKGLVDIGTPDP